MQTPDNKSGEAAGQAAKPNPFLCEARPDLAPDHKPKWVNPPQEQEATAKQPAKAKNYCVSLSMSFDIDADSEEDALEIVETLVLPLERKGGYVEAIEVVSEEDEQDDEA